MQNIQVVHGLLLSVVIKFGSENSEKKKRVEWEDLENSSPGQEKEEEHVFKTGLHDREITC